MLLGLLLGYGASVAEGVAQEKGGRIMELLLCRVRARDLPLTAPMVMPVRIAVGDVPVWEHALAITIMLASTYAVIRLAGSVYSGALLRSGARPGFRAVWRAVRAG